MVPIASVIWVPLQNDSLGGRLTVLDVILGLLWITTALLSGTRPYNHWQRVALLICILALIPELLGCVGAYLFNRTPVLVELRSLKRFGLPSIIPLATLSAKPGRIALALPVSVVVSILCATVVPLFFDVQFLPLYQSFQLDNLAGRNAGTLSNPNDLAYVCVFGLACSLYLLQQKRRLYGAGALSALATVMSLYGIVSSGSRSAMLSLAIGAMFVVTKSRMSVLTRMTLPLLLLSALIAGYYSNDIFNERFQLMVVNRTADPNVVSRFEAQQAAVLTTLHNPLGVGFMNFAEATAPYSGIFSYFNAVTGSDSMYTDFLLATGLLGLGCLLACLYQCWRMTNYPDGRSGAEYLRGALLSALIFGTATVCPASPFVASHFFSIVAIGGVSKSSATRLLPESGRL